ncbi:MAG: polyprenyl synthetase family protein [Chlorobiota bacterium]
MKREWSEGSPEEVFARLRESVELRLREAAQKLQRETVLKQTVPYVLQLPGKRMRPLLCLLAAAVEGADPHVAVSAAAAVEILHTFTLVHDDIMDRSALRRGYPTVHTRWDEAVAILTGDVLIGIAYCLLEEYARHPNFAQLVHTMACALVRVSEGQALDLELPAGGQLTLAQYWQMIEGKTAALLQATLLLGALVGEVSAPTRELLLQLGVQLGRAFQLQDDLLDLIGETEETGKQRGQDLREGKYTYAVLRALEQAPDNPLLQRYRQHRGAKSDEEVEALLELLQGLGVLEEMREQVGLEYARAIALAKQLPATPASELLCYLLQSLSQRRR